jgi:DNA polymerase IV (archaeal DinB-like DNA polymerase)
LALAEGKSRIIICVDLDYFYAQCEEVRKPEIKGRPVVVCVYSGRTEDSGAVSTSNYVARKLGVKSGIPILSAKRILKDNPEAVFLPMDRDYYETVSQRIMEVLRSHSEKFEQVSIDEAFLEVTNLSAGSYLTAEKIARDTKNEILQSERMTCSVGVAPNKVLSKMAADSRKPDGLTILKPEDVDSFLRPMPVEKLPGIGPKTHKILESRGIKTIGDLGTSDQTQLGKDLGKNLGPYLVMLARGIDNEPVQEREREQFSRIITLKQNAKTFDFPEVITPIALDLSNQLISENMMCRTIGIIAITYALKTRTRSRTLDTPTNSEKLILSVASDLFKSYFETAEEMDRDVRRVGIRLSELEKETEASSNPTLTDFLGN